MATLHEVVTDTLLAYYLTGTPAALRVMRTNLNRVGPGKRKHLQLILGAPDPGAVLNELGKTFPEGEQNESSKH